MLKFFVLTLLFSSSLSHSIPSFVRICKKNDPELSKCFVNSINELRPYLKKGIPEMNLPPADPYIIDSIKFSANSANSVINVEVFNGTMENIGTYDIKKLTVDLDKGFYDCLVTFQNIKLNAKYKFKGKLMLFNIDSVGDLKCSIGEIIGNAQWYATRYKKDDKEYFKFNYANITTKLDRFVIQFDNVFKDKALTDNFNSVVNENIDVLIPELAPIVHETMNKLTLQYLNDVYDVFPLDVLYPDD